VKIQTLFLRRLPGAAIFRESALRRVARRLGKDEAGATAIEYTLIATIIGTMLVTALGTISSQMKDDLNEIKTSVDNAKS